LPLAKTFLEDYMTKEIIKSRIVEQVDTQRFREITHSALEGLAKRELNLAAIVGKAAEAKERCLVPEAIEHFFVQAGPLAGVQPKEVKKDAHIYRLGRLLWPVGERLEPRFGKLGREYRQIVFDKKLLSDDPTLEWVTPGHPLFEVVREEVLERTQTDQQRGAVLYDLNRAEPACLTVFSGAIRDGRGNVLEKRLFVVEAAPRPLLPLASGGEGGRGDEGLSRVGFFTNQGLTKSDKLQI
jgi:hypothetical protein